MAKKQLTTAEILALARASEAGKPPPPRPRLSAEEQRRLDASKQFEKIAEEVFGRFEQCEYDQLAEPERACINLWWLVAGVQSGGFGNFFFNDSGNYIQDTLDTLQTIGAAETRDLLSRAIDLYFPEEPPAADPEERYDQMQKQPLSEDAFQELTDELNEAFYSSDEDLNQLFNDYWSRASH